MKQPPAEGQRPEMYYAEGGTPEQVSQLLPFVNAQGQHNGKPAYVAVAKCVAA